MTSHLTPPPDESDALDARGTSAGAVGHIEEWEDLAVDLIDGTLEPEAAAPLEAHLDACAPCREALEQQRSMVTLVRGTPLSTAPPQIEGAVLQALSPAPSSAPATPAPTTGLLEHIRSFFSPRVWLPAAAMVLVVGVAISTYYRSGLDSAGDTSAASAEEKGTELAPLSAQDAQTESAATAQTTTTVVAGGVPADDATVMTEAGTPGITTTFGETARAADAMLENLADRLSTAASGDSGVPPVAWLRMEVPAGEREVIASFVASLIGLAPLSREAWVGGLPTYAALISPDDVKRLAMALGVDAAWMTSTPEDEQSAPTALVDLIDAGQALPVLKTGLAGDDSGQVTWEQSPPQTGPAATEDLAVMVLMMNEGQPAPAQ